MKNLLLIFITTICFSAGAQNFEKSYPYFSEAYGDLVFAHEDGYTLAGLGLFALASEGGSGTQARAILEYGKNYHFDKCLPEADQASVKSGRVNISSYENGISVEANPNPANAWVTFNYNLPFNVNNGELLVTDMEGRMVTSFQLSGSVGQQVWDTRKLKSGTYIYTLNSAGFVKSGKVLIVK